MLEANNPDIDVDALMARVQHEVLRRQFGEPAAPAETAYVDTSAVESLIAAASARGGTRTRWPQRLNVFPFALRPVQRFVLRALNWLFRDQHAYNAAVVQALRESVALNVRMRALLQEMDRRVRRLEGRE